MNCQEAREAISAALDNELTARQRADLSAHLAGCPACAALFDELSGQSHLLRELECAVPEGLSQRILSQLPPQSSSPAKKGRLIHLRRWGTLAACLALILWGGFSMAIKPKGSTSGDVASYAMRAPENGSASLTTPYVSGSEAAPGEDGADKAAGSVPAQALSVHYLRATWSDTLDAPAARLVCGQEELTAMLQVLGISDEADAVTYRDNFFEADRLIAITLTEPSGSITHTVEAVEQTEAGFQVQILRSTPDTFTCDMAAWLILIETDADISPETPLYLSIINQ